MDDFQLSMAKLHQDELLRAARSAHRSASRPDGSREPARYARAAQRRFRFIRLPGLTR